MVKRVYRFGEAQTDGSAQMRELLGGKGCNLAEMCNLGLRVPPGFTITTETCRDYNAVGKEFPPGLWDDVLLGIAAIEAQSGKKFGEPNDPLLVSVRSGAAVSMPGMMDTVLNLGLNDQSVEGLACKTELRFAYDSYRRLLDMFGDVVLGIPHSLFEVEMEALKKSRGVEHDSELSALDLKELVDKYKQIYVRQGIDFPQHPERQLELAIRAVFNSWDIPRAKTYREINSITGLLGTAVNVQTMAFGNRGPTSATGVLFSRDPSTGEGTLYGEYLLNAQGEDVVAGIRTPCPLKDLAMAMPEVYAELASNVSTLERHFKDMQDVEFTIQDGRLFMLQCRNGKRTGAAAIRIAVEMYQEGLVSKDESLQLVRPEHVDQMLHPQFASKPSKDDLLGKGLPASPGAAVGRLVFHSEDAVRLKRDGDDALLVRTETCADDIGGMHAAKGILTQRGGMTSHAAVVARGWGKPCVCGCTEMAVDEQAKTLSLGGKTLREGEWVSINGSSGEVIVGRQPLKPASFSAELASFMQWADDRRALRVFANADTPEDAAEARRNGAQGIGLVRTEHMFFASEERIRTVRQMIMAEDLDGRLAALAKLLPFQRSDFEGIFEAMDGLPVTVRLLDPPLHEFLPKLEMPDVVAAMAAELGVSVDNVRAKIVSLSEVNPMLGLRGCRLGIQRPEITEMQARAVFEAALNVHARGVTPVTDIMVPLVGSTSELKHQTKVIRDTAARVFAERGASVAFRVGTMMEIPRACLLADEVAACTDFFSFGTNDLTQMTFGFSRDDMASFMPTYLAAGIIEKDPFQVLDRRGVGQLIATAVTKGRNANGNLKIGICGEHGGDPSSIEFCHQQGLNYVSCSPFRVPIARLAAAQAHVATETKTDTTTGPQQTTTTTTTTTKGAVVASGKGALPAEVSSGELQKGTAA